MTSVAAWDPHTTDLADRHIVVLGPDSAVWSTDNEFAVAWASHGAKVTSVDEHTSEAWKGLTDLVRSADCPDVIHWTSAHGTRHTMDQEVIAELFDAANSKSVPIIGVHLDRFWDIKDRERWIATGDAYFRCDYFFTADGGNQHRWEEAGYKHHWLPPGVSERHCHRGVVDNEYDCQVTFVGSHTRYHREATHRRDMLGWLTRSSYDFKALPARRGKGDIREEPLVNLYWSADLAVGDSFWVSRNRAQPLPRYCSDRIPESLGRGAIFAHPIVEGVTDEDGVFGDAPNLLTWKAWQWTSLGALIDKSLSMSEQERTDMRLAGIEYVREHHTYERRVIEIWDVLSREGMI